MNEQQSIPVEELIAPDISDADIAQLAKLHCLVFPRPGRDDSQKAALMKANWDMQRRLIHEGKSADLIDFPERRFIVRRDGKIIANASTFPRRITTANGPMTIAALGGVATDPDYRGLGLGKAVVLAVFAAVDRGQFPFSLFQTGKARPFYEKLGCALVTNPIVNSHSTTNPSVSPFHDTWVMRYPAPGKWPAGEIDLLGSEY